MSGTESLLEALYVVIVRDRYDEESISFVLGPFEDLKAAQDAWMQANKQMEGGYRPHSIERLRRLSDLPEWERRA